jgi:hypothetical protein
MSGSHGDHIRIRSEPGKYQAGTREPGENQIRSIKEGGFLLNHLRISRPVSVKDRHEDLGKGMRTNCCNDRTRGRVVIREGSEEGQGLWQRWWSRMLKHCTQRGGEGLTS